MARRRRLWKRSEPGSASRVSASVSSSLERCGNCGRAHRISSSNVARKHRRTSGLTGHFRRTPGRSPRVLKVGTAGGRARPRALPSHVAGTTRDVDRRFVDCHSHVVPSGDDGAATIQDGLALCKSAAQHCTVVLFATPHVWPYFTLSEEREAEIRTAYERMRPHAGLELRLGFELTPATALLEEDPSRYLLAGTTCVLMEVPFSGPTDLLYALAEHVEAAGLRPVIAHPERTEAVLENPAIADDLADRGWM